MPYERGGTEAFCCESLDLHAQILASHPHEERHRSSKDLGPLVLAPLTRLTKLLLLKRTARDADARILWQPSGNFWNVAARDESGSAPSWHPPNYRILLAGEGLRGEVKPTL